MQVSTKGKYALRFLLDLCEHQDETVIPLKDVAERQNISKKYLERVISLLAPSNMLRITRGYQGGYQLTRDPKDITVAEVLRLTEGSLSPVDYASLEEDDITLGVWEKLESSIVDCLEGISLQDILDEYSPTIEYYI